MADFFLRALPQHMNLGGNVPFWAHNQIFLVCWHRNYNQSRDQIKEQNHKLPCVFLVWGLNFEAFVDKSSCVHSGTRGCAVILLLLERLLLEFFS